MKQIEPERDDKAMPFHKRYCVMCPPGRSTPATGTRSGLPLCAEHERIEDEARARAGRTDE